MSPIRFDEKTKLWNTCDTPLIYNPSVSIAHTLLKTMEWNGPRIAQISDKTGEKNTFDEIRIQTIRAAQNLQKHVNQSKQVVGILAPDVPELAPVAFAFICLGCPVMCMPRISKRMLRSTEPALIICDLSDYDELKAVLIELKLNTKLFTFNGTTEDSESAEGLLAETGFEEEFVPCEVDGINDTALIMCTSGTTGYSKGACISHAGLICEIQANMPFYANGIAFNPNAFCCISGVLTLLLGTMAGATRIITTEEFSLEMEFRIIQKQKVTVVENDSYDLLLMSKSELLPKTDLSSVKYLIVGGCRIPYDIRMKVDSYLPNGNVHNEYGLVELGGISMDYPICYGKDSAGRLLNGFIIKIVDTNGERVGINVDGEICVKRHYKFIGYWKSKELTDAAYDSEGFFQTGDIGHIDENGILCVTGRKKDVIDYIYGWVFPSEVEDVLLKFSDDIDAVCVVGVPFDEASEVPAAIVVRANGSNITEEEIHKIIDENMSEHCKLRGGVYFTDSILVSERGKVLRNEMKEIASNWYRLKMKNEITNNCVHKIDSTLFLSENNKIE